jgi:hypothetical protein
MIKFMLMPLDLAILSFDTANEKQYENTKSYRGF